MELGSIIRALGLESLTPSIEGRNTIRITSGHASDLLSDVLANAPKGSILVTIQIHMNVIAVALHAEVAAVVFSSGLVPEEDVRARAVEENLPLFASREGTFDIAGRLYALGLRGRSG